MYILYKQNTVLVIDPHINEEIKTCFFNRNIRNVTIILTHEHSDHISGVWCFLENYEWQGHKLYFKAIQGHSIGSSYIILDNKYVFTGDSLIKDYPIIVNFPQSNKNIFVNETIPLLEKTLYSDMIILSGHGKTFVLSEIMKGKKINVEIR